LRDEINRQDFAQALTNIKTILVECMRPVCEAATAVIEQLRETFAGVNLGNVTTMLDWAKENAPQIAEQHAADALDAMVYTLDQLQIIEQEPAQEWPSKNPYLAHHGYVCGIDLANGPDFTAGGGKA
jgi:hypothetical protein